MAERRAKEADESTPEKVGGSARPTTRRARPATAHAPMAGKTAPAADAPSVPPPRRGGPVAQLQGDRRAARRRASSRRSGPIRVLQALRWDDRVEEQFLKSQAARAAEGRRRVLRARRARLRPDARRSTEFEEIARDIDRELGERGRHRADHDDDGARVPRRRAHARGARHAGVLRVLAQALRLAEGQVPRRTIDRARPRARCSTSILTNVDERPPASAPPVTSARIDAAEAAAELERALRARTSATPRVRVEVDDAHPRRRRGRQRLREGPHRREVQRRATSTSSRCTRAGCTSRRRSTARRSRSPSGSRRARRARPPCRRGSPRCSRSSRSARTRAARDGSTIASSPSTRPRTARASSTSSSGSAPRATTRTSASTTRAASSAAASSRAARPFTKDACYCKGIVLNYAFIRSAIQHDRVGPHPVPLRRQGRARGRAGARAARRRRRREAAALPAADVPRPQRARDLDGVLDVLLAARRRTPIYASYYAKLFARAGWTPVASRRLRLAYTLPPRSLSPRAR